MLKLCCYGPVGIVFSSEPSIVTPVLSCIVNPTLVVYNYVVP